MIQRKEALLMKENILPEILLAEPICEKLKIIYFLNVPWNECYRKIGNKLTEVKRKARTMLVGMTEIEMLQHLRNFSTTDIEDMINDATEKAIQGKQVTKNDSHMDAVKKNTTSLHTERRP